MNQIVTSGIILSRINFAEADRILAVITPDQGKLRIIAKGVRKAKSKLSGGIELFSISSLTIMKGRSEIYTLISSRLASHFGNIIKDADHLQTGYELLKTIDRTTEEGGGQEYYDLLHKALAALDETSRDSKLTGLWFWLQFLKLSGHLPSFKVRQTDAARYTFDAGEAMEFRPDNRGRFTPNHIKLLRVAVSASSPQTLGRITGVELITNDCFDLARRVGTKFVRP